MRLYNTLGREIQDFHPVSENEVKLYTCGPTVYSYYHIGNLRNAIFNDTLRRALQASGYNVKHVMNITDVGHLVSDADEGEDKLEKGAKTESKSVQEVVDFYTEAFIRDMKALNVLPPNGYSGPIGPYARATDFIDEQIEIINILLEKEVAYKTEQAVYFDIAKLNSYGELTGQKLSEKEEAARDEVVTDQQKRNPQDFALWFFTVGRFSDHSLRWMSPWGEGFPGWHLECSAIIHATLSEPIDIHTGGVDHIGTHHPNEMAQTEAAFGHKLANYWVHNEHILIDGQKMSKSLDNAYTLEQVVQKGFDPMALRLLYLQAHYRTQMNFTWDSLEAAAQNLAGLRAWADLIFQTDGQSGSNPDDYEQLIGSIKESLQDDLNTARGLALLNEFINGHHPRQELLHQLDDIYGLNLLQREDISPEQKHLIEERESARNAQNWDKADALRKTLLEQGIEINDTSNGPVWQRK